MGAQEREISCDIESGSGNAGFFASGDEQREAGENSKIFQEIFLIS